MTKKKWYVSGFCKLDNCYHIGTRGRRNCTGIRLDETHSMKEVIADVWDKSDAIEICELHNLMEI